MRILDIMHYGKEKEYLNWIITSFPISASNSLHIVLFIINKVICIS